MKQRKLEAMFYSLLSVCAFVVLAAGYLYGQEMKYEEFVTGLTTWSGYPKKADMQVVQLFLLGTPACFFLFQWILKKGESFLEEQKKVFQFLKIAYVIWVFSVFAGGTLWKELGLLYIFSVIVFFALGKKIRTKEYKNTLCVCLFSYLSVIAALEGTTLVFASFEQRLLFQKAAYILQILSLVVPIVYMVFVRKQKEEAAKKLFAGSKLLLPMAFFGCFTFYYETEQGVVVQLFYSGKWKLCCIAIGTLLLCYEGYRFYKKKYDISVITIICTGLLRIFTVPDGILNVDFFHMGEMTLPMQQLVSYGKLPYFDLVPIHGMCDYFYQIWNYLFLDGTYLSFNGAMVIGNIVFVIFYGVLFYKTIENKQFALLFMYGFIPFFVELAGMRYVCVFAFFFLMFSKKIKSNSITYLWWWVFLSIVSIGWNASLGGTVALGFMPAVLYKLIKQAAQELPYMWKEKRKKLLISYGILFVTGISFIPLFLQIVIYLKENTGTTLYVNGMEMLEDVENAASYFIPGLLNSQGTFFLKAFCVLGAIGICLYYSAYSECITLLLSMLVFMNYAYVRYEEGLRAKILGIFFLLLTLLFVMKESMTKEKAGGKTAYLFLLGFLLISVNDSILLEKEQILPYGQIPDSIETTIAEKTQEDAIAYISKEQTGMENIGTGFIRGSTLQSLQNINHVLSQALEGEKEYLDLTNGIAQTVILNGENAMTYTSGYNISNDLLNENAIAQLEENPPKLILVAPYIKLDDVPLSLRSMKLYEHILNKGYEPYQYENVIYMIKGENKVEGSQDGREAFANLMHREYLAFLPAVWADAKSVKELEKIDLPYIATDTEEGIEISFKENTNGKEVSYIMISIKEEALHKFSKEERMALKFGEHSFEFDIVDNQYLIPVGSSPFWKWQESLSQMIVSQEMGLIKEDVEIVFYRIKTD